MAVRPDDDDVVIRTKGGNPTLLFVLGTALTPNQFQVRSRDEAVAKALAFAKRQKVRAWLGQDDDFVLLGTFRAGENSQGNRDGEKKRHEPHS